MKKYIFMAVAGMLALSSCSNDNDEQNVQNAPRQMTFTAGFGGDGAQTRASISGKAVSFDALDHISILSEKNIETPFVTDAGGASASFHGGAVDDAMFYAVYPCMGTLSLNSSTGIISGIRIPDDQSAAASSTCGWDPAAPVAWASTTGTYLNFHNLCALLKVTNDTEATGEIGIVDGNYNANMAGTFDLNTSSGALTNPTDGKSLVYVQDVPAGKTVYIAIAPCEVEDLVAYFDDGEFWHEIEKTSSTTFEAGKIYNLGNISDWPEQ